MKKNKYEISLWEDILKEEIKDDNGEVLTPAHYEEEKICVIGSSSMTSPSRAVEPRLVQNVNGSGITHV